MQLEGHLPWYLHTFLGLQVVAGLLEESLGHSVYARRYCPGGYTWRQHLADAQNPNRSLYRLLGEGGKKHWDYIIFQVCHMLLGHAHGKAACCCTNHNTKLVANLKTTPSGFFSPHHPVIEECDSKCVCTYRSRVRHRLWEGERHRTVLRHWRGS